MKSVCPHCGFAEEVPDDYAGQIGECEKCGNEFRVVPAMSKAESVGDSIGKALIWIVVVFAIVGVRSCAKDWIKGLSVRAGQKAGGESTVALDDFLRHINNYNSRLHATGWVNDVQEFFSGKSASRDELHKSLINSSDAVIPLMNAQVEWIESLGERKQSLAADFSKMGMDYGAISLAWREMLSAQIEFAVELRKLTASFLIVGGKVSEEESAQLLKKCSMSLQTATSYAVGGMGEEVEKKGVIAAEKETALRKLITARADK